MSDKETRRKFGLHYWDITNKPIGNMIPCIFGLSNEALLDLLPDDYKMVDGFKPNQPEKDREEWQAARLKKACVCVRAVADAILSVYKNATITVTLGEQWWNIPPFQIKITSLGHCGSDRNRRSLDYDPMIATDSY